jgi:hypothetical protein
MYQTKGVEKIRTYILCSLTPLFFLEYRAIYEIMWKNILLPDRPQMTNIIWCMHIACWTPKAKNTQSQYVIFIAVPQQQWLHELASILRYA